MADVPNTKRDAASPPLPEAGPGVALTGPPVVAKGAPCLVSGAFRVPDDEADALGPTPHRALVLSVTSLAVHHVNAPFARAVLFTDDIVRSTRGVEGFFNADAFSRVRFSDPGIYYVTAALGRLLSNTLEIHIG